MALITCKNCGHTVSDKAEKCPKCGYPVRLSMKQNKEAEQSAEIHSTTGTEKQEVVNNEPQPKGSKKGLIMAVVAVVIIGCGVLFAVLNGNDNSNSVSQQQDTAIIADNTGAIVQDELPSDSVAVATENDNHIAADSCAVDELGSTTFYGSMTDANGTYPIELSFEQKEDELRNCIYKNVDLGGKIRMDGGIVGDDLVFTGKDGNNSFRIIVNRYSLEGYAKDGNKELKVSFKGYNTDASQQETYKNNVESEPAAIEVEEDNNIYDSAEVEVKPEFKDGGMAGLMRYISQNLRTNSESTVTNGRVVVSFVIEKDGSISNIEVTRSLDSFYDKEACRIIGTTSGKWKPAQQNGKTVRARYRQTISVSIP